MIYMNKLTNLYKINSLPPFLLSLNNQIPNYNSEFDYLKITKTEEENLFNKYSFNIPID
jgi:hypothetical protein